MCNQKGTPRFRTIEVIIDSTSKNEFPLSDEENLRDARRIIGIEAYKVGNVSMSPTGRATVNDTVFAKSFLVISTAGTDEVLYKIPFADLDRIGNNGQLFLVDIPPIAPSKCKIVVGSTASLSTSESFVLAFHYEA